MKKRNIFIVCGFVLLGILLVFMIKGSTTDKDVITIDIGYQSVTSQTWGALIMKNQSLFEQKLNEKFPDTKIRVNWHNEVSGAAINSNMVSSKYQIGFMGNMPCLINGYNGTTMGNYDSILVAIDGKGLNGKNQGIVVPKGSSIKTVADLEGKTVSVPVGSSAHFMLLQILNRYDLIDKVTILHQDVTIASTLLETNKIDAFAAWDPYPRLLIENGSAELLADGSESNSDYLTGIMVNKTWAEKNNDILVLFLESLLEAHDYIINNPEQAARIFADETAFPEAITLQEAKEIKWEAAIYDRDRVSFEECLKFLIDIDQIKAFDFNSVIDTSYLNQAIENLKMDLAKSL